LEWDSEFWGFPVGEVSGHVLAPGDLAEIDTWCNHHSVACLYFLATSGDPVTVRTAEDEGFRLTDVRVTFEGATDNWPDETRRVDPPGVSIRPSAAGDVESLQKIAAASHRDTRFFFDLNFPRAKCELLYARWIAASCSGFADIVFVGDTAGEALGYITCHLPQDGQQAGRIGLVGVAPMARGRGLGRLLVQCALSWFASQHVDRVTVVTQGRNVAAQVLYQRCGFVTRSHQLWFHKWYDDRSGA
jgi:ribosomal protein S18 acetylase RimI-like enzyme